MSYQTILFDLDGTLTDPADGILNAVVYALEWLGIEPPDRSVLLRFIGPPLRDGFRELFGFEGVLNEQAVAYFREYFSDRGIFENSVYDGIPELLRTLKGAGKTLLVATSKAAVYAERIVSHFGLAEYFDYISGSELDGTRSLKSEVIAWALAQRGVESPEGCVMVGDREHDIVGAKRNGLASIGVLYGYGSRTELEAAGADAVAEDISQLKAILL